LKKSAQVRLGLLATLAVSLTSCNRKEMQRCVDDHDIVVSDQYCEQGYNNSYPRTGPGYHWYYGGRGSYILGTSASGGGVTPHDGFSSVRSSGASVSRGGFGSSASHGGSSGE
jgi:hypothetical protein